MVSIYEYDEEKEMKLIRADDAQRAASDENDRKALYKEYGFF